MNLEEYTVVSSTGEYTRDVWYLPSEQKPRKICLFLDGEYYVNQMDAPAKLIALQREGLIPPVVCLFVSHLNGEARHDDYTCNERYSRFIAEDLIAWVRNRNSGIAANECLIGGLSLSGLQAAYTAIIAHEIFMFTLCQSGSLWWNKEWLKSFVQSCPTRGDKFWISVGDQETDSRVVHPPTDLVQAVDQISAVERFVEVLKLKERTEHYHLFQGGHDPVCWKDEFSAALQWLLGPLSDEE